MNALDLFSLKGKKAVVTGGCGYLGKGMVQALVDAGAFVYVVGTSLEKYETIYSGNKATSFIKMDITDGLSIKKGLELAAGKESRIDVLINNAAHIRGGGKLPEDISDQEWEECQNGVAGSVFKCIRETIPYMEKNGGSIINIASMYGVVSPDLSLYDGECALYLNPVTYGSAKASVVQMTKYFGAYLIKRDIRVNSISPGTFPSKTVQQNDEFVARLKKKNPAGRIGLPEDLMGSILYLASDASKYVVGQNILVDGGWTIW